MFFLGGSSSVLAVLATILMSGLKDKSVLTPHFVQRTLTGLQVLAWLGWVALPTCSLNLVLGPLAHSPLPFTQLTQYPTPDLSQSYFHLCTESISKYRLLAKILQSYFHLCTESISKYRYLAKILSDK